MEGGRCAAWVTKSYERQAGQYLEAAADLEFLAVRVQGGSAFAVYRQPKAKVEFFPLDLEDGRWRIAALGGSLLPAP